MADQGMVELKIGNDVIAPIVESKIKMAVIEAMGDKNTLIEQVVGRILMDKVDSAGNKSSYSSDNRYNFIDVVLRMAIEKACKEAVAQFIQEKSETLRAEVEKQLRTKNMASNYPREIRGYRFR